MNTPRLTSLVLVLGVIAASLVAMTSPATAADPTRILIVGDSVTHGRDGDYTWRYFAWKGLQQTGANVDFVGPNSDTAFDAGGYADPNFDRDHAARWGLSLWETLHQPSASAPRISDTVTAQDPDVIVEVLGVNDFLWLGQSAEAVSNEVRTFVAESRSAKANVDIVLGSLPQTWIGNVSAFNALLVEAAAELDTPESRVIATPVAAWSQGVEAYDTAHPTSLGERKLAESVSVALEQLGIGSAVRMSLPVVSAPVTPPVTIEPVPVVEPIGVIAPVTPPVTPVAPTAAAEAPAAAPVAPLLRAKALSNGKVKVAWSAQADSVKVWVRAAGRRWKAVGGTLASSGSRAVRVTGQRIKVRAASVISGRTSPFVVVAVTR